MRLLYVQPLLASYRNGVIRSLESRYDLVVAADVAGGSSQGFSPAKTSSARLVQAPVHHFLRGRLAWQKGLCRICLVERPDIVLSFANPRFLSFWLLLILSRLSGRRFYSHGQGLYAYPASGLARRILYRLMVALSTRYICYTELSRQSLLAIGCPVEKLAVADNSIDISACIEPQERSYAEDGLLFIGRLREGCRLEHLVEAVRFLLEEYPKTRLHVIGAGDFLFDYQQSFADCPWIVWHGSVHDHEQVAAISRQCRIGCYPGDAGLSVVHFFGLALPPLVHQVFAEHMGPEPSYVRDGVNGFLFAKTADGSGLKAALKKIWDMDAGVLREVGESAFHTYKALNAPSLGDRFLRILTQDEISDGASGKP